MCVQPASSTWCWLVVFSTSQKLSKDKEALKGQVATLERELQQERQERKAAVAAASAAAQAQVRQDVVAYRVVLGGVWVAAERKAAVLVSAAAQVQVCCRACARISVARFVSGTRLCRQHYHAPGARALCCSSTLKGPVA